MWLKWENNQNAYDGKEMDGREEGKMNQKTIQSIQNVNRDSIVYGMC